MKFLLIVIFTSSGFSAEFNNKEACLMAASLVEASVVRCVPKGKTDLNKLNDSLYKVTKELFNGD